MEMLLVNLLYFFIFVFGLIIGSFLNVVIYRHNTGMTLGGRSMCFSCGKQLQWFELVPLFSFLFLRGKCSVCKSKISWQYPAVELATGLLFLGAYLTVSNVYLLAYLLLQLSLLVVISVYDFRHKIIPDTFSYAFAGLALVKVVVVFILNQNFSALLYGVAAGLVCFLPFAALWYFSKGKWMGFGDAKLALGIGWFLGIKDAPVAILLAFWIGALVGIAMIVYSHIEGFSRGQKKVTMKSEMPFGPFLILGLLIMIFLKPWVADFLSNFIFYSS